MADKRKLSDLIPDHSNANKGTERGRYALEASLRQFGAGRSILLDKNGRIIAGNKTAEVAADVGLDDVIVVQTDGKQVVAVQRTDLDIDSEAGRGLAYADNRVGELSLDWDAEQVLADLNAGVDLSALWREDELNELIADLQPKPEVDAEPQIDRAEELRQKWGVEPGQLWQLGEHRLICGDCTDAAVVARVMAGEKAQAIITSPPYFVGKEYETDTSWDEFLILIETFISVSFCSADDGCYLFVNFSENTNKPIAMAEVYRSCATKTGFQWHSHRVWKRPADLPIYASTTPRPCNEIEYLHTYRKPGRKEIVRDIKVSSRMLWETGGPEKLGHSAAFPVDLASKPIVIYSNSSDVIYEPFSGSGTTIMACEQLGRRCRAVEIAPGYVAVALERWATATGKTPELIPNDAT